MEYKEGTVFELGDIKNRFIVISIVNIDTLKDEDNGTYVIVAPLEGSLEKPVIDNSSPMVMKPNGEGIEIIVDEVIIKEVLMNM